MSKKEAGLSYERAIEIFRYDAENGLLERKLKSGRWKTCGHKADCHGYGVVRVDGKNHKAHRLVWLLTYGEWPEHEIDHLDRNRMNNRISNLRAVTTAENGHNRRMSNNNSSGYPGVSFNKQHKKYVTYIGVNDNITYLGLYNTAEEAFLAYQLAKIQYHPTSPIAQQYLRELTLAG